MVSYNNAINFSLIALVVIITIHILFNNRRDTEPYNIVKTYAPYNPQKQQRSPKKQKSVRRAHSCPVDQSVRDHDVYLQKFLLGATSCPSATKNWTADDEYTNTSCTNCTNDDVNSITVDAPKSTKEFHDDFFGFRDRTYQNSSMREDPVDKIQTLYLSGNISEARRYPNMKIKDLFDEATKGPNLYERQCVRVPQFDNVNPEGHYVSYGTPGMSLSRDKWQYDNEKIINGGEIENGIYGNDLYAGTNFPVVHDS